MNNTDILELKKRLKKENSITRINAAYVIGMEKKIQTTVDCYFSDLEESEQFKYLELIKKGFSGVLGKNLQTLSFVREEGEENAKAMMSLLALRDSELKDEINESVHTICKHYNVPCLDLHNIDKQWGHPSIAGMKSFADQVVEFLKK